MSWYENNAQSVGGGRQQGNHFDEDEDCRVEPSCYGFQVLGAQSLQVQDQLVKRSKRPLKVRGINSMPYLSIRVIGRESDSDVSSTRIR
mmetsp:Transcript_19777/g.30859  ORF Transcript_19777/g.30859 Transcript_19777/m.30859 type:complete len:89 (-) Transcript_19777:31-297(-)